jgi:hypothetical protein
MATRFLLLALTTQFILLAFIPLNEPLAFCHVSSRRCHSCRYCCRISRRLVRVESSPVVHSRQDRTRRVAFSRVAARQEL